MNIHTPELIEDYVLEIISRAQVIKGRCENLLSKDFASEAPKNLAKTLINICSYLENATKSIYTSIDWGKINKIERSLISLQTSDFIVRDIGSHIRYVDGAQTQKLPWSFISPLEKYLKKFRPDIEIMFRPQWKYNYTIITMNLYDYYLKTLTRYKPYDKEKSLEDILKTLKKSFYIVSFPTIERKNILLHCLLGHEIGHLVAKEYFTSQRNQELLQSIRDKVATIINNKRIEDGFPNVPPLFIPQLAQQVRQAEIERANKIWQRGLEEILSDIIGSFLFGPAVLFSTLEIALQDLNGLDKLPDEDNNYYPPWRMRLRNIFEVIKDSKLFPLQEDKFKSKKVVSSVTKRFNLIENIIREESDKKVIESNDIVKFAYEEIDKDIIKAKEIYAAKLESLSVKPSDFYKHLPHLIERIDYGIPPNAYEKSINEREPATIVEVINAAWFHKLSWEERLFDKEGNFNEEICEKRDRMNRLALKALEYSDIEEDYIQWHIEKRGQLPKYEVDE
ncbi:MAG: hypothetical protein Q8N08_05460 [Methanobacteriaceae archaeon]|nr:hypothetical protein [Methanobacteriaceae archaeon]